MEETRTGLIFASMVAIIAIFGLVVLFNAGVSGAAAAERVTPLEYACSLTSAEYVSPYEIYCAAMELQGRVCAALPTIGPRTQPKIPCPEYRGGGGNCVSPTECQTSKECPYDNPCKVNSRCLPICT